MRCALQESFEWADLRTLTDNEIKPHSQHPLPGLARPPALPAPARSGPIVTLPAAPVVPGATSEQVLCCVEPHLAWLGCLYNTMSLLLLAAFRQGAWNSMCWPEDEAPDHPCA